MKIKKYLMVVLCVCACLMTTGCGKKCTNGCGEKANPKCMAEMCDSCCDYWMGLNGCYESH